MRPQSSILEVPQVAWAISFPFSEESASKSAHLICHSALLMDSTYCVLEMKGRFVQRLAGSSQHKSPWNWRDFCCGGNRRPQSALVPSPERGTETQACVLSSIAFAAQRCGHTSCWPAQKRQLLMVAHQGLVCRRSSFRRDLDDRQEAASRVGIRDKHSCCWVQTPDSDGRIDHITFTGLPRV